MDVDSHSNPNRRRRKVFAVLPTLLTLGNAVCGFSAITILAQVGPSLTPYEKEIVATENPATVTAEPSTEEAQLFSARMKYFSERMVLASQLIFLAMLFDVLDGSAARLTRQTSEFGAQLDSLCDVISFGVAPGIPDA